MTTLPTSSSVCKTCASLSADNAALRAQIEKVTDPTYLTEALDKIGAVDGEELVGRMAGAAGEATTLITELRADNAAKDKEIERLRDKAQRLSYQSARQTDTIAYWSARYTANAASLSSLLKRVKEGLKPFASAADDCTDDDDVASQHIWEHPAAMDISIADLRRARSLLTEIEAVLSKNETTGATQPVQVSEAGRGDSGWRTMESAPRDGSNILGAFPRPSHHLNNPHFEEVAETWWEGDRFSYPLAEVQPTHWRPLPLPPETGGKG